MRHDLFRVVTADPVKVKEIKKPASAPTKKVLKESHERTLEDITDDEVVLWADVKRTYPSLEAQLKTLFAGKDRLTVGELKDKLRKDVSEESASFWLSKVEYNPAWDIQRELPDTEQYQQIAVQLNIGPELVKAIDGDPLAQKFFTEVSKKQRADNLHPNNTQTVAWARVYILPDKLIVEELQSDIFGASLKTSEIPHVSKAYDIINKMPEPDKAHLEKFFHKHFLDWDKKLLASVIAIARKKGIKDIYMWDDTVKAQHTTSTSKLNRLYKVVPRDLGFKKDTLEVEGTKYGVWHRVVASFSERVAKTLDRK